MSHVWDSPGLNRASLLSGGLAWASPHANGRAPSSQRRTSSSGQALFKTLVSCVILAPLTKACHEAKPNSRRGKQTPLLNGRIYKNIVAIFFHIPSTAGHFAGWGPSAISPLRNCSFFPKENHLTEGRCSFPGAAACCGNWLLWEYKGLVSCPHLRPEVWPVIPASRVLQWSAEAFVEAVVVFVQSLSRVQLFVTPWTPARQASLSFTISQSLLRLMSI